MEQEKPQPLFLYVLVSAVLAIALAIAASYAIGAVFAKMGEDDRFRLVSGISAKAIGLFIGGFAGGMTFSQLTSRKKK
jgi:uncharacterized membrane protein required for colicin V production